MRKIIYLRFAGRDVHLPKLIGAFILIAAFLMFVVAGSWMLESWENTIQIRDCLRNGKADPTFIPVCQQEAKDAFNVYIRPDQTRLGVRQAAEALLPPIAATFFWLAVFLAGIMFYKTGSILVPIEQFSGKALPSRRKRKRRWRA